MTVALIALGVACAVPLVALGFVCGFLIGRRTAWTTPVLEAIRESVRPSPTKPEFDPAKLPVEQRTKYKS